MSRRSSRLWAWLLGAEVAAAVAILAMVWPRGSSFRPDPTLPLAGRGAAIEVPQREKGNEVVARAVIPRGNGAESPPISSAATRLAELPLPRGGGTLAIRQLERHPFLAEYERTLVLTSADGRAIERELLPDTGGYSRSQLYAVSDGEYVLRGYFDAVRIATDVPAVEPIPCDPELTGEYLGAFDFDAHGRWRFLTSDESAEAELDPTGGS